MASSAAPPSPEPDLTTSLSTLQLGNRVGDRAENPILLDIRTGDTAEDPILVDAPSVAMPAASAPPGAGPPPLPPSVEAAYKQKCIQLKKRMNELDAANVAAYQRKIMMERGVRKLRLQRAILLNELGKIMKKNGEPIEGLPVDEDEDSDGSSEGPPTPHEKPLRSKRSHRRPMNASPPPALHPASSSFAATPRGYHNQQQGYESTFSAHPSYHHQQISPAQGPGYRNFNPSMPGQQDAFSIFVENFVASNPALHDVPRNEQVNLAHDTWAQMSPAQRRQHQTGYGIDEERYERVEAGLAALRGGAGAETGEAAPASATAADTTNDNAGNEVKDEAGDEEMGEAKGGFTAVNG
ncbi:MAG: hypothetical protein Q9174_001909 [Haloplaca sp. 1 TL-2023]